MKPDVKMMSPYEGLLLILLSIDGRVFKLLMSRFPNCKASLQG